uniref:Putative secreted protein n=1 Tax=Anopheles darlingi TaxID=43151 RepID=A0A2M4D8Z3_ANODA
MMEMMVAPQYYIESLRLLLLLLLLLFGRRVFYLRVCPAHDGSDGLLGSSEGGLWWEFAWIIHKSLSFDAAASCCFLIILMEVFL